MLAVWGGHIEAAEALAKLGSDVYQQSSSACKGNPAGSTALTIAQKEGRGDIAKLLKGALIF